MSQYDPNQPPHFSGQPIPPHLRDDNVIGNSPLNPNNPNSQAYKPKKRHIGRNIAIAIGGLFMLLIVAAVLTPGSPDSKAPVTVTSQAGTPVDNGPTPDPVVTPTNKPSAAKPTAPKATSSPKVTHKPAPTTTKPVEPAMTASQEQAVGTAEDYLDTTAFSKTGLIDQLVFEGFSKADAKFAVAHITVNWSEQAALSAKSYLSTQHFSRSGLIGQLEFEGFTHAQAVYGVSKAGL